MRLAKHFHVSDLSLRGSVHTILLPATSDEEGVVVGGIVVQSGDIYSVSLRAAHPGRGAGPAEVAAELREVDCGGSGRRAIQAEVPGRRRFPGLLHAGKRGEHLLLGVAGG